MAAFPQTSRKIHAREAYDARRRGEPVTLNLDTTRALRTSRELHGLAVAVRDAPAAEPETDSIEWKGPWDLTDAEQRFETARHILGFGNRLVSAAAGTFEGCAYLLAGVEPGNLVGVTAIDPAKIDDAIGKHVLHDQPRWTPTYVDVDGHTVLIITIEAPRDGDPQFTLQQGYGNAKTGRIFVRRHGKTVEASPAEIRGLEARLLGERPKVELSVVRRDDAPLHALSVPDGGAEGWVAAERARLLAPLAPPPPPPVKAGASPIQQFLANQTRITSSLSVDGRSKPTYEKEVERYLARADRRWFALIAATGIARGVARLRLAIANPTERNFERVQVELDLPEGVTGHLDAPEAFRASGAPDPPTVWNTSRFGDLLGAAKKIGVELHEVTRGKTVRFQFAPCHVRPGSPAPLPDVHLIIPPSFAGSQLAVGWRLTSTSVDGWQDGEVAFDIENDVVECDIGASTASAEAP